MVSSAGAQKPSLVTRARHALLGILLPGAAALLFWFVNKHYPLKDWLFWRYCGYWAVALLWTVCCLAAGFRALELLRFPRLALAEETLYALCSGLLLFFLVMFLLGIAGVLGVTVLATVPVAFLAFGFPAGVRVLRRLQKLRREHALRTRYRLTLLDGLVCLYGLGALLFLYLSMLHPENIAYDSRWYHLPIAEQYVAEGAIRPSPEGWHLSAFPHLASLVFTWVFLIPRLRLFDYVEICAHIEFIIFVATMMGLVVLFRRLVPKSRGALAWVATFLFPGIFLYDSSLHLTSDHIAAFWAPALFLAFLRAYRDRGVSWYRWSLLCLTSAGVLLTKYSATCLLAFLALAIGYRTLKLSYLALRHKAGLNGLSGLQKVWLGPAVLLAGGLVLTAPHWFKNWLWYGNPVYPYAFKLFKGHPWEPYCAQLFETWWVTHPWQTHGTFAERSKQTLEAMATFSFVPHDWINFHGMVPVFGSLFTLCSALLPFVRVSRAVWALTIGCYLGIAVWFSGMQFDRYLQILLPWMTCVVAAVLHAAWHLRNRFIRIGVVALVASQIIWGLDLWSIPAHAMLDRPPILRAVQLIQMGYQHKYEERFDVFEPYRTIGLALDPKDKVLLHDHHLRLGLKVPVINDGQPAQTGLDYGNLATPRGVYDRLRSFGVTKALYMESGGVGYTSYAGDLVFHDFITHFTTNKRRFGSFVLSELKDNSKPASEPGDVAYFGCYGGFRKGLYSLQAMNFAYPVMTDPATYPRPKQVEDAQHSALELIEAARYVVYDSTCKYSMPDDWKKPLKSVFSRGTTQYFLKR
jgi:hypothetical protein